MLQAILLNKAGRNISTKEVHWRELFRASEDSLTSTVIGTLLYLPSPLFWQILNRSCYGQVCFQVSSKIETVSFWPRWRDTNDSLIEPDVFIRTSEFDLIIEAKRFDDKQQYEGQWLKELSAYFNDFSEDNKKVFFIAMGGIYNENIEEFQVNSKRAVVIKCRWFRLLNEIKLQLATLENKEYSNYDDSAKRILKDIISGFGIHGYSTGTWFGDQDFSKLIPISLNPSLQDTLFV
ncbi:MAG: hypothetical protein JWQ40_5049 [Segetibacter sp.]|jgi:hypothetical protein|nr:hypothetical protein [Segetibacter sp.]